MVWRWRMSIVQEVITRLTAAPTPFALVEGAGQFAQVRDRPNGSPAAFVFVKEEASGENSRMSGGHLQEMQMDLAVSLFTDNAADANGEAAAADIEAIKAFVRSRLVGWKPASAELPLSHVSGQVIGFKSGGIWFEDLYSTLTFLETLS